MTRYQKKALAWVSPGVCLGVLAGWLPFSDGMYNWGIIDSLHGKVEDSILTQQMVGVWMMVFFIPLLVFVACVVITIALHYIWQGRKHGPGQGYVDVVLSQAARDSKESLRRMLSRRAALQLEQALEKSTPPAIMASGKKPRL